MSRATIATAVDAALVSLFEKVKGRVSEEDFLRRVKDADEQFGGLLDAETLGLLVLDELGLNEGAYATLADLKGRSEATVRVTVERVEPPRTFERAGRDPGRVGNVVVSDATGDARLVFWDRDVERMEDGTLRPGAHVTVVNARVKDGRFGPELHVGPWTVVEVEGALDPAKRKLLADVQVDASERASVPAGTTQAKLPQEAPPTTIEGRLAWVSPTRTYRPPEGGVGFVCDADVDAGDGPRRVVAWNESVKALRSVVVGERMRLENLLPKLRGAGVEWHTTNGTKITRD